MSTLNNLSTYGQLLNKQLDATPTDYDNAYYIMGSMYFNTVKYTAAQIDAVLSGSGNGTVILNQVVTQYSTATAIAVAGKAGIVGGTGLAMTLAAPVAYAVCDVNIISLTALATVTITLPTGVTFDGTNNTATFDAADQKLVIGYQSATRWLIQSISSGVVLSFV